MPRNTNLQQFLEEFQVTDYATRFASLRHHRETILFRIPIGLEHLPLQILISRCFSMEINFIKNIVHGHGQIL